jgi:hypothetical protein
MEQDKKQQPPHNEQTRPADTGDKDKLRENPHNDEKTISQKEPQQGSGSDVASGSTFAQKDQAGKNQVTNEQEQDKIVNPRDTDLKNLPL